VVYLPLSGLLATLFGLAVVFRTHEVGHNVFERW